MRAGQLRTNIELGLFIVLGASCLANAITLTGPITANLVNVNGDVTVSSISAGTMNISNTLITGSATINYSGAIIQTKVITSTTNVFTTSASTWTEIPDMTQTIALSNANNYVRLSLSGILAVNNNQLPVYITIFRGSTNLGDTNLGLSTAKGPGLGEETPVGITIIDQPGDTTSHQYQVYIRTSNTASRANYPFLGIGYLLLEEVGSFN